MGRSVSKSSHRCTFHVGTMAAIQISARFSQREVSPSRRRSVRENLVVTKATNSCGKVTLWFRWKAWKFCGYSKEYLKAHPERTRFRAGNRMRENMCVPHYLNDSILWSAQSFCVNSHKRLEVEEVTFIMYARARHWTKSNSLDLC